MLKLPDSSPAALLYVSAGPTTEEMNIARALLQVDGSNGTINNSFATVSHTFFMYVFSWLSLCTAF